MEVSAFSWLPVGFSRQNLDSAPVPSSPVFPSVNQMFYVKITIKIKSNSQAETNKIFQVPSQFQWKDST